MTDANFKKDGYTQMIEGKVEEKITSIKKTYASVAFWVQNLLITPNQKVHIRKGVPDKIFCLHRVHPHPVGIE